MSEKITATFAGGRGKTSTFTGVEVDTLVQCRETFGRITKAYAAGEISENQSRTIAYLLSQMLSYWRLESDLRIEERLAEIERRLEEARK